MAAECAIPVCTPGDAAVQIPCKAMHLRLIRNATLRLEVDGKQLLVDPMLDPAGARPPVENTENDRRNPLVELPEPPEVVVEGVDAVLVTHLHSDHFDATAARLLPKDVPVLCQPEDAARLRDHGFTDVRPVGDRLEWEGIAIARMPARHGYGEVADAMAPVSGFLIRNAAGRRLYLAGDTVLYDAVEAVLDEQRPDVVVVNGSAARFRGTERIVMDADDVVAVAHHVPQARVVVVHLDAVNHGVETRADLHQRINNEQLAERVTVPEDGAAVPVD
jgi:L-ascorbate metabolism protein UlaG (beta-lactamase superfamily)